MSSSDRPNTLVTRPTDVPVNYEDWSRILKQAPTLNDQVELLVAELVKDAEFRALINATTDDDCLEGSISADDQEAARMIRNLAEKLDNPVKRKKLTVIKTALRVVLKRYGLERRLRARTVGGQVVPINQNPDLE